MIFHVTIMQTVVAKLLLLLCIASANPLTPSVTRVVFASCNRHWYEDQSIWRGIARFSPQLFIWTGDAVYVRNVSHLADSFSALRQQHGFQAALSNAIMDGVYDDHDFGSNDAGKEWAGKQQAQAAYLDFLHVDADDPRRQQQGLYHAQEYRYAAAAAGRTGLFKTVLLDTRYFRDSHLPPSVGGVLWLPVAPLFAASIRVLSVVLGLAQQNRGDVLGEVQWEWLEQQLCNSSADVHLLVSSIQVGTTNPFLESWGHFPVARQRLFRLLHSCAPAGLSILSGDVHFAELLGGGGKDLTEVTSSGMTHTCSSDRAAGGRAVGLVCRLLLWLFGHNRISGPFTEFNFGTAQFSSRCPEEGKGRCEEHEPWIDISIRDQEGQVVMSHSQPIRPAGAAREPYFESQVKLENSPIIWALRLVLGAVALLFATMVVARMRIEGAHNHKVLEKHD